MNILLALGNVQDTGGPTSYAQNLKREFARQGHDVQLVSYRSWLWGLPSGLRHIGYALQLWKHAARADVMLAFDTLSVGAPALLVSKLTGTPLVVRIGGDFLWEQYTQRTGDLVKLSCFYMDARSRWNFKEHLIFSVTNRVVKGAAKLVFNCRWLPELWRGPYTLHQEKIAVVENMYPERRQGSAPTKKNFVAAGRALKLKNETLLRKVLSEVSKMHPDISLDTASMPAQAHQERIKTCYAVVLASVSDVAPNAVIDAVAWGKPFICTADTGIQERLQGTGLFVNTQNETALRQAIETLLDPAQYQAIEGRIRAFNFMHSWDEIADEMLTILTNACE